MVNSAGRIGNHCRYCPAAIVGGTILRIGIDIGSTTVKVVVLDDNDQTIFQAYERHMSKVREKTCGSSKICCGGPCSIAAPPCINAMPRPSRRTASRSCGRAALFRLDLRHLSDQHRKHHHLDQAAVCLFYRFGRIEAD